MTEGFEIEVRQPHDGAWIYVREGSANKRVVSLMAEDDGPVHLVADNIVEHLRAQGIEPPCERNNMRYFHATLFFCCERERPEYEDTSQFFFGRSRLATSIAKLALWKQLAVGFAT